MVEGIISQRASTSTTVYIEIRQNMWSMATDIFMIPHQFPILRNSDRRLRWKRPVSPSRLTLGQIHREKGGPDPGRGVVAVLICRAFVGPLRPEQLAQRRVPVGRTDAPSRSGLATTARCRANVLRVSHRATFLHYIVSAWRGVSAFKYERKELPCEMPTSGCRWCR